MATEKKARTVADDRKELQRIRRAINDPMHYGSIVDGVHTWDAAEVFKDFRMSIQIARRALKKAEAADL